MRLRLAERTINNKIIIGERPNDALEPAQLIAGATGLLEHGELSR
jgi:hypothetical protein